MVEETSIVNEQMMDEQEQRLIGKDIYDYIKTNFGICFGLKSWKLVMGKTLSFAIVFMGLPDHILHVNVSIARREVIVEVAKTLNENKHVQNNVQLAIKDVILIATINVHITSSIKGVARAFGVHHINIMGALSQMMLVDTLQEILYYVTIQFATT